MICATIIYGYNILCVICCSKLLRIFVMCNAVTSLLNLSKYFVYKLSYVVLDSLYCQWKDSDFFRTCSCLSVTGLANSVLCKNKQWVWSASVQQKGCCVPRVLSFPQTNLLFRRLFYWLMMAKEGGRNML
jgi:hypothetical protein